jgi:hypothetical protein
VVALTGAITIAFVLTIVALSPAIFGGVPASGSYDAPISIEGQGVSEESARTARELALARTLPFLANRGFVGSNVRPAKPADVDHDERLRIYLADQTVDVYSSNYAKLARLDNAIPRILDPTQKTIMASFPSGTFIPFSGLIALGCLLLLCVAVAALDTREADVSRAPRGMHPVMVGAQTALYGFLVALAIVYAHVLAPPAALPFVVVSLVGVGLLGIWLVKTRPWWNASTFMRRSWYAYAIALVGVIAVTVWALAQPLT